MIITPIKTEIVRAGAMTVEEFLDRNLDQCAEHNILAISSKIVALCENRIAPADIDKESLIKQESDYSLPRELRKHGGSCAIAHHAFIGAGGVDRSNADGCFVLLPADPQASVDAIYDYLRNRFGIRSCGVIMTDSHSTPFRRGASGISLAWRGFRGLRDYRGALDVFGRPMHVEQANIPDAIAAASVLAMGEGNEQTPITIISDISGIIFDETAPTEKERAEFFVDPEDDIFSPILDLQKMERGDSLEKRAESP
jgi:F420-0:gamma-glutamyl ligase